MLTLRSAAIRFSAWVQTGGLIFIMLGATLAWGAVLWNALALDLSPSGIGLTVLGSIAYLALAGMALAGLRVVFRRAGSCAFAGTAFVASVLIQLAAIWAADPRWEWTGDARIFQSYLDQLSSKGYVPSVLEALSRNYDYPIWTRRALPFYLGLRCWAGDHFVRAIQIFQAMVLSLSLFPTWRTATLLFGKRVAFWATTLQLLMPFRWIICLDLNHYLLGSFYFSCGVWVLAEWSRGRPRTTVKWLLALWAFVLLPLMRLEGGIDQLFIASAALVVLLHWASGIWTLRQATLAAGGWIGVPLLACAILLPPLSARLDAGNAQRLSSGTIAFMARGWMPETGGEYSAAYEQIDWLTPVEHKAETQTAILISQVHYNLPVLLFRLLPIKLAKFFSIGYASGAEEMLNHNGMECLALPAKGARIAYALIVLPLLIPGGLALIPLLRRPSRLSLILPCFLFSAAMSMLGETSPRYSIYIQPFLFMLGALALSWSRRQLHSLHAAARIPGCATAASIGLIFLLLAGLFRFTRPWLQKHAFQDMRSWIIPPLPQATSSPPATLEPFEIRLAPQIASGSTAWGPVELPALSPPPHAIVFYVLSEGVPSALRRTVRLTTETAAGAQTNSLPARIRLEYPPAGGLGEIRFGSPAALPYPLRIGYAK